MTELDNHDLLAQYARTRSEAAFAALVSRYVNLVYSAALRFTGNPHHAQEITQSVFVLLARKAGSLRRATVLSGWLYQTARLTAANFVKGEIRRQRREQEAYVQSTMTEPEPAAWEQIAPALEEAMGRLGEADRNAIVLRFFENKTAPEIAAKLNLNESAAHKRVSRALEKLRRFFVKRGVALSGTALAGALAAHAVQAAPVALAKSVTVGALAQGAAGGSTLTLINGILKIMALSKAKTVVVLGVAVLLATGTATFKINAVHQRALNAWETTNFDFPKILSKVPPQVRILPTKFPGFFRAESDGEIGKLTGHIGIGAPLRTLVQSAFEVLHQDRIIYPTNALNGPYDYFANLPHGSSTALQQEMKKALGLSAKLEMVDTDVLLLKVKTPNASGLKPTKGKSKWTEVRLAEIVNTNMLMSAFATQLEDYIFNVPVLDQTGLTTAFDMDIRLPSNSTYMDTKAVRLALLEQLGLELVPAREPVEMLVVRKVK